MRGKGKVSGLVSAGISASYELEKAWRGRWDVLKRHLLALHCTLHTYFYANLAAHFFLIQVLC